MPMSSKFLTESTGEKIVKIGQYLAKIWTKYDSLLVWATLYTFNWLSKYTQAPHYNKAMCRLRQITLDALLCNSFQHPIFHEIHIKGVITYCRSPSTTNVI